MNALEALFARNRQAGRAAFIPFVTAGDPNLEVTAGLLKSLGAAGADIIEIGFPFSDPVADGPVIQASYTRALRAGFKVDSLFDTLETAAAEGGLPPLVGMVSYSIVHRKDPAEFLARCRKAGLSGLIVPDLPLEEAAPLAEAAKQSELGLILLVTPTTSDDRVRQIAALSTGFLYGVSLVGITGERGELPDGVREYLGRLRALTDKPLCIGFGIGRPEQVAMLKDRVDGVIVGSALVREMEGIDPANPKPGIERVAAAAERLLAPLRGESPPVASGAFAR